MKSLLFFIALSICILSNAQTKDTIFNQTDKTGHKQGFWKARYPNGIIKYTAFFKDDKPVGMMKRYSENGKLKADMLFDATGTKAKVKMYYYQNGELAACGNFINTRKDSIWNYYSFYSKKLAKQETYTNGNLNGIAKSYFQNGKIAEERGWKNGVSDGIWKQYFENGVLKMSSAFSNGKRTGAFLLNYPDNKPEWIGAYLNDKPEGKWKHFDTLGQNDTNIEYKNGEALNAAELDAKEKESMDKISKMRGRIPEPDENSMVPGMQ
ncbi:MAG: toxin-antitoxin system YwqK family antitoxin [Bacteroidota bacterium]|nr:toxin-antitoxin system YwqK family antitoxin [Bacteroidota bacterium]